MATSHCPFEISAIIMAHAEGRLLHPAVVSAERTVALAELSGCRVQRLLVASSPSAATLAWLKEKTPDAWAVLVLPEVSDLAEARNCAVQHASGHCIAFFDGDDLCSEWWLSSAYALSGQHGHRVVVHPELTIFFGERLGVQIHNPVLSQSRNRVEAGLVDPFRSGMLAARTLFEEIPFQSALPGRGFGFADWHWTANTLAAGFDHVIAIATWHYVRTYRSGVSLRSRMIASMLRLGPTELFEYRDDAAAHIKDEENQTVTSVPQRQMSFNVEEGEGLSLGFAPQGGLPGQFGTRERLTAERSYYVADYGSDENDGRADSPGGAFLTVQRAVDATAALDLAGFAVTIHVGKGTYLEGVLLPDLINGLAVIVGDEGTPSNVVIETIGAVACFAADGTAGTWNLRGMRLQGSAPFGIFATDNARLKFQNLDFATFSGGYHCHLMASSGGRLSATGNYSISGGANVHWAVFDGSIIVQSRTVKIVSSPVFDMSFAFCSRTGVIVCNATTFSGSASGTRYRINGNGVVDVGGGAEDYLPGDMAGLIALGGQYI